MASSSSRCDPSTKSKSDTLFLGGFPSPIREDRIVWKHLVVDGLIGVGKSSLCARLGNRNGEYSDPVSFMPIVEVAHKFALEPFIELSKPEKVAEIDATYDAALEKMVDVLSRFDNMDKKTEKDIIEEDIIRTFIAESEHQWFTSVHGIFQNVMLACSYSPLLLFDQLPASKSSSRKTVFAMDRDPRSNPHFFRLLDSNNHLSPIAKAMYRRIYSSYDRNFSDASVEIWLWCRPSSAVFRIASRGRGAESGLDLESMLVHQARAFRTILSIYSARPRRDLADCCDERKDDLITLSDPDVGGDYSGYRPFAVVNWDKTTFHPVHGMLYGSDNLIVNVYSWLCQDIFCEPYVRIFKFSLDEIDLRRQAEMKENPVLVIEAKAEDGTGRYIVTIYTRTIDVLCNHTPTREKILYLMASCTEIGQPLRITILLFE